MLALQVIKNNLFPSGVLLCAFCSFFEILSLPISKVKRIYKNRKMNNKLRDLSQSGTQCCELTLNIDLWVHFQVSQIPFLFESPLHLS